MFGNCIKLFFMSMIPIWELRGSYHCITGHESSSSDCTCLCGMCNRKYDSCAIYICFCKKILKWGVHKKGIGKPCRWILKKGHNGSKKLGKKGTGGVFVALMIFVGIPLPGTGAWTGTLVASFLEFGLKRTFLAILCGVLMAGGIMTTITLVGLKMFGM